MAPSPYLRKFRKRVMFPIANESGRVIAFTGRTLETERSRSQILQFARDPALFESNVFFNLDKARSVIAKRALRFSWKARWIASRFS